MPPSGQRLAWLTGFTGSAGLAVVLTRARRAVRRWPLHAAGGRAGRSGAVRNPAPDRGAAGAVARRGARQRAPCSATTPGCTRRTRSSGCAPAPSAPAPACARSTSNPLDRVWPGRPAAPLAPVVPHPDRFAGESARRQAHPPRPRARRGGGRRGGADNARIDRLAAQYPRRRRAAYAAAAVLRDPARRRQRHGCSSTAASSRPASTAISATPSRIEPPDQLGPGARRARRAEGAQVQADPATAASWVFDRLAAAGATSIAPPIRACCRKPARTRSSSTAPAPRIAATAPP